MLRPDINFSTISPCKSNLVSTCHILSILHFVQQEQQQRSYSKDRSLTRYSLSKSTQYETWSLPIFNGLLDFMTFLSIFKLENLAKKLFFSSLHPLFSLDATLKTFLRVVLLRNFRYYLLSLSFSKKGFVSLDETFR